MVLLALAFEARGASDWKPNRTVQIDGLRVTVSEPVLVAKSTGSLWFPTLARVNGDRWLVVMSDKRDEHTDEQTGVFAQSDDGGLSWGKPGRIPIYSECPVALHDELLLLPNYLYPQADGSIGARYLLAPHEGGTEVRVKESATVGGWPRPLGELADPKLHIAGFVFNGQSVALKDDRHLVTLYGRFKGTTRYALVVATSRDGRSWQYRATVADEACKLPGKEGPCEAALCRLRDGRLMCVFRMDGGAPYGRSFSTDEGRTWSEPDTLKAGSVQPSLAVMPDGLVALSGGRPGVSVWFDVDGDGNRWQPLELLPPAEKTSAYTEIVPVDDHNLLCVFDRIPHGWDAIPAESKDVNSVWVVRLTVQRQASRRP
jgi:hypothetical protein